MRFGLSPKALSHICYANIAYTRTLYDIHFFLLFSHFTFNKVDNFFLFLLGGNIVSRRILGGTIYKFFDRIVL